MTTERARRFLEIYQSEHYNTGLADFSFYLYRIIIRMNVRKEPCLSFRVESDSYWYSPKRDAMLRAFDLWAKDFEQHEEEPPYSSRFTKTSWIKFSYNADNNWTTWLLVQKAMDIGAQMLLGEGHAAAKEEMRSILFKY